MPVISVMFSSGRTELYNRLYLVNLLRRELTLWDINGAALS
jgi:hypothetical protein